MDPESKIEDEKNIALKIKDQEFTTIVSVIIGIVLGIPCIVMTFLSKSPFYNGYQFHVSYFALTAAMFISMVFMVIIFCIKCRKSSLENDDERHRDMLLVGNVFFFAMGYLFIDILLIAKFFHCAFPMGKISQADMVPQYVSMICYHLFRFSFTIFQLIFIQTFSNIDVTKLNNILTKMACSLGFVTNFSLWISTFFFEAKIFSSHDDEFNLTCTANLGDAVLTYSYELVEYFQPFIMEFSLVAMVFYIGLFRIISKIKHTRSKHNAHAARGGGNRKNGEIEDESKHFKADFGLLIGIPFSLFHLMSTWNLKDDLHVNNNIIFSHAVEIITNISIIGCFYYLWSRLLCEHRRHGISSISGGKERGLLYFSGFGGKTIFHLLVILFTALAFRRKSNPEKSDICMLIMTIISSITSMLSVFSQICVLRSADYWKHIPVTERKQRYVSAKIKQFLFFLIACNLSFWTTISFFDLKDDNKEHSKYTLVVNSKFGTTWVYISKILYPINIFYHFHSVELMVHMVTHFSFNSKSKSKND